MAKKFQGYEFTEEDIDSALRSLIYEEGRKDATREDAIEHLEKKRAIAHLAAHKIVEDEKSGKIKPVKLKPTKKS